MKTASHRPSMRPSPHTTAGQLMSGGAFLIGEWLPGRPPAPSPLPPPPPPLPLPRMRSVPAPKPRRRSGASTWQRCRPARSATESGAPAESHSSRRARATHAEQSAGSDPTACQPPTARPRCVPARRLPAQHRHAMWVSGPQPHGQFMTLQCSWRR